MKYENPSATKQVPALQLAIEALTRERRRICAAGEAAYRTGIRKNMINSEGVTGEVMSFAEDGHKGYTEYSNAIRELEDLIEIVTDPGPTKEQPELFGKE